MPVPSNWKLRIFPVGNALYDAASMTMAARELLKDEDVTDLSLYFFLMGGVLVFSLIQSYVLCADETVEGIEDTVQTLSTRQMPENWVPLSRGKEILALTTASAISLCAVSSDFFGGWYFVGDIPEEFKFNDKINMHGWQALAIPSGIISGITTFFTEGKGVYYNVRRILAGESNEYKTSLGKYLCYGIGYPIALIGNLEVICEANSTMTDLINPQTQLGNYGVLLCSVPKGVSDFFFSGKFAIQAIDDFTARMLETTEKPIQRPEVEAFLIALLVATLVEFPQPYLTFKLLDDEETAMPFSISNVFQYILGYGVSVRDGLVLMVTLYPLFLSFVNKIERKLSNCWYGNDEVNDDNNEIAASPYSSMDNIETYLSANDPFSTTPAAPPALSRAWPSFFTRRGKALFSESELTRSTDSAHSSTEDRQIEHLDYDEEYEEKSRVVYQP